MTQPFACHTAFAVSVLDSLMSTVSIYMTQPFACGTAFAVSVLDSLMSTVSIYLTNLLLVC